MSDKKLVIGLFGFGVVGEALYKVIEKTPTLDAEVRKICIRHGDKARAAPAHLFTTQAGLLLHDPEINVIVELIDDADAAYRIVTTALRSQKAVVSANKKMIAANMEELIRLQQVFGAPFLYEAACCASIPVIRNLEEYYDNDLLQGLSGIVNGSTNYILTRIAEDGSSFADALQQAQAAGFAERDPTLDISGADAVNKLSILLTHAYGIIADPAQLVYSGITQLDAGDARYAREKGYTIKLVAQARKLAAGGVAAFVLPQFVEQASLLASVARENNGVVIESGLADRQFFFGKGAGGYPTASAVLSDISALRYGYRYEYKKRDRRPELADDFWLDVSISFPAGLELPAGYLDQVYEWSSNRRRNRVTARIHYNRLATNDWWRQQGVSLVLLPDAIAENSTSEAEHGLLLTVEDGEPAVAL